MKGIIHPASIHKSYTVNSDPLPPLLIAKMTTFRQRYLQRLKEAADGAIPRSDGSSTSIHATLSRLSLSANPLPVSATRLPQKSAQRKESKTMGIAPSSSRSSVASKKRKSSSTASNSSFEAAATTTARSKAKQAKMSSDCSKGGGNADPSPHTLSLDAIDPEITDAEYENVMALMNVLCKVPFLAEFTRPDKLSHPEKMTLYSKIIPHRNDLGFVCRAIRRREYDSISAIQSDVQGVFSNFIKFFTHPTNSENPMGQLSSIVIASKARHLRDYFDRLWHEYMMPSDEPPRSPGKGISHVHSTFQKRAERRSESLPIIESTVLTAKFVRKLSTALESFISSGGKVDNLDRDAILGDMESAPNDTLSFVRSLRRVICNIEEDARNGKGYTVLDLHNDVKQCYTGKVFEHEGLKRMKISQRLDRILGKLLAPICEMSRRGVNQSRVWGCMAAIVRARKSNTKPYWPAIVLGILAPDDLKEDWHSSLTDQNEARLPKQLRDKLRVAKIQAEQEKRKNPRMGYFLVEFMGSHEFIWVREDNIIEPYDPNVKRDMIQMSSAIEEGRLTLNEFEILTNDACADGFDTDDEVNDSTFSFENLCQSDDVIEDRHVHYNTTRGSEMDKLYSFRDADGLQDSSFSCSEGEVDQEKDRAMETAETARAKASQKCETDQARHVRAADLVNSVRENYSGSWTPSKALAAMNSSSDSDSDEFQTFTDHTEQDIAAKKKHSPPILQSEVQDELPESLFLKSQQTNRNDIGLCSSSNDSFSSHPSKEASASSSSSVAAAANINSPPINKKSTITTPPKTVSGPPTLQNCTISASNNNDDNSNTEDANEVKFSVLYSPIMNSSPNDCFATLTSNSTSSSTSSSASAPCNSVTLNPNNVVVRTATTRLHHDAVLASGRNNSVLNQDCVIDLTLDTSDDEDIESRSSQDIPNNHMAQQQQNDGIRGTELQNLVSDRAATYQETIPVGRSAICPNQKNLSVVDGPLRTTTDQSVTLSHGLQQRNHALRGPNDEVHENCSNGSTVIVDTTAQLNMSDSNESLVIGRNQIASTHSGLRDTSAIDPTGTRQVELTEAKTSVEKSALISCSLTGTLAVTKHANGSTCHVIRGTWVNMEFPTSTPLKFELRRDVSPTNRLMPLISDGDFYGTFTCRVKDQKGRIVDVQVNEKNVTIHFIERNTELYSYTLRGAGENQFGKFDLDGKACKLKGSENYRVEFRKLYTELAQSRWPDIDNPAPSSGSKGKELPLSCMDDLGGARVTSQGINEETQGKSIEIKDAATDLCRTSTASTDTAVVSCAADANERKSTVSNQNDVIETLPDSSDNDCISSSSQQDRFTANVDNGHKIHRDKSFETIPIGSNGELNRNKLCFDVFRAVHTAKEGHTLSTKILRSLPSNESVNNEVLGSLRGEFTCVSIDSGSRPSFYTPLSYHFLKFIVSEKITSDETLANVDSIKLGRRYMGHLRSLNISNRLCRDACRLQGLESSVDGIQWKVRVDADANHAVMNNVPDFCRDDFVNGLPMRTICTIGPSYDILYEFVVSIKRSTCCAAAGNGAFLTFRGAKVLKASSKWKQDGYQTGKAAITRGTREAVLSNSRYIVSLTGTNIHDDNRVEFIAEDFVDTRDNITFSSKHIECGLVELENRYGPLIPADRKKDFVFTVKDFLFSHEPSAWRFDVEETVTKKSYSPNASPTLYDPSKRSLRDDQPTVVDFTDDATGAPHSVASSHVSMYVNEVGHSPNLIENVEARNNDAGYVTYYINIDKPMAKGDTVELLVNYKDAYERMRVRRGYGRENLFNGVQGDDDDMTRVQRNVQERIKIETNIKTYYVLRDVVEVVYFLNDRVWDRLKAATSVFATGHNQPNPNLPRQCIARRRIDWITRLLSNHLDSLLKKEVPAIGQFQKGMYVFVHEWPQEIVRPSYTGLAMIDSIARDVRNREIFTVITSDNKFIWDVPEAVVTIPTADDMESVSKRDRAKWKKWEAEQAIPQILDCLAEFKWDPSFARSINAALQSTQTCEEILDSLRWEFVEEILFLLEKNKRISPNFVASRRCPLSVTFVSNCLLLIADFLLLDNDNEELFRRLMDLVRLTGLKLHETMKRIDMSADLDLTLVEKLTFELGPDDKGVAQRRLVVQSNNEMSLDQFLNHPTHLDYVWYAVYQIALPLHKIASLIDWGTLYSVEKLCEELSINLSEDEFSKFKDWHPLV